LKYSGASSSDRNRCIAARGRWRPVVLTGRGVARATAVRRTPTGCDRPDRPSAVDAGFPTDRETRSSHAANDREPPAAGIGSTTRRRTFGRKPPRPESPGLLQGWAGAAEAGAETACAAAASALEAAASADTSAALAGALPALMAAAAPFSVPWTLGSLVGWHAHSRHDTAIRGRTMGRRMGTPVGGTVAVDAGKSHSVFRSEITCRFAQLGTWSPAPCDASGGDHAGVREC
jgi:hypothetical protein